MKLNNWDYEQLEKVAEILEREKYCEPSKTLKMIIRKTKKKENKDNEVHMCYGCSKEWKLEELIKTPSLRHDGKGLLSYSCGHCGTCFFTIQPDGYHWKDNIQVISNKKVS